MLVRLRYSEINPGEVTGYAVAHPGYTERDGSPKWYGGGRLAAGLTLPRLRRNWDRDRTDTDPRAGSFRLTGPEREQFYLHAAQQANAAAEQIRRSAGNDPSAAADTAWAAAAAFHATARAIGNPALRDVADAYDRAARMAYGKIPPRTAEGDGLRAAARLLAMAGGPGDGGTRGAVQLTASLVRLARAVGELRQAEQHAAQAAAARQAAERLYASLSQARGGAPAPDGPQQPQQSRTARRPRDIASLDFPAPPRPGQLHRRPATAPPSRGHSRPRDPCAGRPAAPDRAADSASATGFRRTEIQGRSVPPWFNTCRLTVARPVDKSLTNDLEAGPRAREPASDLRKLVGDTGIEPVTSSVSTKRSPTELTALEAEAGIEPAYRALQALA